MKKLFLVCIFIISGAILLLNTTKNKEPLADEAVTNDVVHTVTLQYIEPIKEGDEFGWMLISEPGQLGYSLNALGLNSNHPAKINEMLGEEENTITCPQDGIDLEKICNKLGLGSNTLWVDNTTIRIPYSEDDMQYPVE